MSGNLPRFFASDKEIYDLLESAKRRMTRGQLLKLARDRRIFLSQEADRETIVDYLSSLPHDLDDVEGLLVEVEPIKRAERSTFIELKGDITAVEIGQALEEYRQEHGRQEHVTIPPFRENAVTATFKYSEFDFSKTTLLQRQEKSAGIEFRLESERVIVRMPATEKGQLIVKDVLERLAKRKETAFSQEEISVAGMTAAARTKFFLSLMRNIKDHRVEMVTSVKVNAGIPNDDDFDEEAVILNSNAESEMLGFVKNVALSGENLLASPQFHQLQESGFFITSMTWRAIQIKGIADKIQFEVSFDNQEEGTGFKYLVRYSQKNSQDEYSPTFKNVPDARRKELFRLIELAAREAMEEHKNAAD